MEHEFDKKYPEFEKIIGIKFSQMKTDTQTALLAEWMKAGQWEKVNDGKEFIDPFMNVNVLNENSFHEWLLTNPEECAFDLWKSIRNHAKQTNTYSIRKWGDSAALILYANLPERLCALDLEEWSNPIDVFKLKKRGIKFYPAANVSDKIKKDIEEKWFNDTKAVSVIPMKCACYHGSDALINASIEIFKKYAQERILPLPSSWQKHSLFEAFKWYIYLGDEVPLSTLIDALHITNTWTINESYTYNLNEENKKNLLEIAFLNFGANRIKDFLKSAPNEAKNDLFSSWWDFVNLKRKFLEKGDIKILNLIQCFEEEYINESKLKETIKDKLNFKISDLWQSIKNGNTSGVCWLLDRHPEWLEEKDWVYKNSSGSKALGKADAGSKKGTPLVCAAIHGHKELVDLLLEKGASTTPLKDIMNYTPFKNSTYYKRFMSIAEHILLNQKVIQKINVPQKNTITTLTL